jgi:hypothetical protein
MNNTDPITKWDDREMAEWTERLRQPPRGFLLWFVIDQILTLL